MPGLPCWGRRAPEEAGAAPGDAPSPAPAPADVQAKLSELSLAAADALACSRDRRRFVNESEAVLNRFHRAIIHLQQAKLPDEKKVLNTLVAAQADKEQMVRFLLDCVRNRFLLWAKVSEMKKVLVGSSASWRSAFDTVSSQPPYNSVELPDQTPPQVEETRCTGPRRPIPFILEALALGGLALPVVAAAQGCSCHLRWALFVIGILLLLLWLIFELLWCKRRERVLRFLLPGDYAVSPDRGRLICLWAPSKAFCTGSRPPDAAGAAGAADVERPRASGEAARVAAAAAPPPARTCVSYGQWFCVPQPVAGASVTATKDRGPTWSSRSSSGGSGSESSSGASDSEEEGLAFACSSWEWSSLSARLEASGMLSGLPAGSAAFDGDCVVFPEGLTSSKSKALQQPLVWVKFGWRRLEWLRKTLILLALVGTVLAFDAAAFAPGLTFECGPLYNRTVVQSRTPLRAVFILDASSSVMPSQWEDEKKAALEIYQAFLDVYAPQEDRVYVGAVQFASTARVELPITNNRGDITRTLPAIQQQGGGTRFDNALRLCAESLAGHTGAGPSTYDLCVLVTDGEDTSGVADFRSILTASTHLMGIYVGTTASSRQRLQDFTCGAGRTCSFFASAEDFARLSQQSRQLAEAIGKETVSNEEVIDRIYTCHFPRWTLFGLLGLLPALLWWIYLRLPGPAPAKPPPDPPTRRDPIRLNLAGKNEDACRTLELGGRRSAAGAGRV